MPDPSPEILAKARALYEVHPRRRTLTVVPVSDDHTSIGRGDGSVITWDELAPGDRQDFIIAALCHA